MKGRTVRIFLVDGAPTGVMTAEVINWTGKVLVAPRSSLSQLAQREESRRTGIYFLVGADPDLPSRERVYIGEGDSVLTRLAGHDRDAGKDFWTRAALVISKDENITKSHGRYLESRFITLAKEAGRTSIANSTAPEPPALPESDLADMEYFIDQVRLILPIMGFDFLKPKPTETASTQKDDGKPRFVYSGVGAEATAIEADGEFVVLTGSTARKSGTESWGNYRALRDDLVDENRLVDGDDPNCYRFAEDVAFSSPSAAGSVVTASNVNGRRLWMVEGTNRSYADWQDEMLQRATAGSERTTDA